MPNYTSICLFPSEDVISPYISLGILFIRFLLHSTIEFINSASWCEASIERGNWKSLLSSHNLKNQLTEQLGSLANEKMWIELLYIYIQNSICPSRIWLYHLHQPLPWHILCVDQITCIRHATRKTLLGFLPEETGLLSSMLSMSGPPKGTFTLLKTCADA
jgi:hypothetical protein